MEGHFNKPSESSDNDASQYFNDLQDINGLMFEEVIRRGEELVQVQRILSYLPRLSNERRYRNAIGLPLQELSMNSTSNQTKCTGTH
jgi:hypothetical protein